MVICYCIWWCETGTFWSFWDGGKEVSEVSRPRGFPKVEIPAYVVRSFGSQGLPHWGPLQFFSYLYLHSHTHCSVRKFKEEIMMPEVLVCLSNYWSSNLHDILHNHMGRNLKITFWSLSWTQAGMTKACQIQRSGPGGRGLEPASAFPALWSLPTHPGPLFIKPAILSDGFTNTVSERLLGNWCDFWLRLLCMRGNKKERRGDRERETTNLRGTPCPTERRAWWQTKQLIVSSSTKGPGKLAPRGAAVTHLAQAVLALHISTSSMVEHLGYLMSASPVLRDLWCLPNLAAGSFVGKVMLWEATLRPHALPGGPLAPLLIVLAEMPVSFYSMESAFHSVLGPLDPLVSAIGHFWNKPLLFERQEASLISVRRPWPVVLKFSAIGSLGV